MNTKPRISMLIPTYEHPEGISLILKFIKRSNIRDYECIINDDSDSDDVQKIVKSHPLYKEGNITFYKNNPALGAVKNWNKLIKIAKGDYLMLLHHDECPVDLNFFDELNKIIALNNPSIIFLRCLHYNSSKSRLCFHMPIWLIQFVLSKPDFLLLHNVIGAPSNVVFHRSMICYFDENLRWLVDAEWMMRLLKKNENWILAKKLGVISSNEPNKSITEDLGDDIPEILKAEIEITELKHKYLPVFKFLKPKSLLQIIYSNLEQLIWLIIRLISYIFSHLLSREPPKWLKEDNEHNKH